MKLVLKAKLFAPILCIAICTAASGAERKPERVGCDVHAGPCRATLKTTQLSLEIQPKPVKAMQDLTFTITFSGPRPQAAPYIDLTMPGMKMGRNRVILELTGESVFQGKGVIVR
jgi:hypothetical protein